MSDALTDIISTWRQRADEWEALPDDEKKRRSEAIRLEEEQRRLEEWADQVERKTRRLLETIPRRYREARVTHPQVKAWLENYPTDRTRDGLYFVGGTGTGKTWEMFGLFRAVVEEGRTSCRFASMPTMLDELRPREAADSWAILDGYIGASLLFLDDLGAHKPSEWAEEKLYQVIDQRWQWERPTIVATNVPKNLGSIVGERVASRLAGTCELVKLVGSDRRRSA